MPKEELFGISDMRDDQPRSLLSIFFWLQEILVPEAESIVEAHRNDLLLTQSQAWI